MKTLKQDRTPTDLQVQYMDPTMLIPDEHNARTHSDEQHAQLLGGIREFGFTNPILIRPNRVVIAGHARLMAALKLGLPKVPVIVLHGLTETQYRALAIADNRIAQNAGWDEEILRRELALLEEQNFDVGLLGFEEEELADMLAAQGSLLGEGDENDAPELPDSPVTLPSDLWILGKHRLLCGDATVQDDLSRLMGTDLAAMVFEDPPYNVDYEGYTDDRLKIQSDNLSQEEFSELLVKSFRLSRTAMRHDASMYVCHPSSWQRQFEDALESAGFDVRCQIIWAKNTFAWGFGRYKFQHEPIFYCHITGETDLWYGDKAQSTVWHVDKPAANRWHPTMKPVDLVERALVNSSRAGDIVLDSFGGAGSTLIACQRRNRNARLLEIDPKYVDVIVLRWQQFTGKQAMLADDGRCFAEVKQDRNVVA